MQPQLIPLDIFFCLQFFIPLLFVLSKARVELSYLNLKALIVATNITILIASLLTIFIPVIEFGVNYYSGGEYEQYTFTSRYVASITMLAWLLTSVVMPQIMWHQKIRRSIISSCVWLVAYWLFWLLSTVLIKYISSSWAIFIPDMHWFDYAKRVMIFFLVIVPIYLLVNTRHKKQPARYNS